MLPLVDKLLIQYIVNECVNAGIKEIVLVTHSSKNAIENHFDTSFELEATLEARVKRQLLDEVQAVCPKEVTIMHVRQGQEKGLGHAVLCAKPLVGDEPFAVVLPDVILDEYTADQSKENLAAMTPPGVGDEIQLTDAIDMLMQDETVEAFHMTGRSHDCGDKLGYAKAFVEYGMRDKALGEAFTAYIKTLNDTSFTDGLDLTPLSEKTDA